MRTVESVRAEIAKLEAEIDRIQQRERAAVIDRIRDAMEEYNIKVSELRRSINHVGRDSYQRDRLYTDGTRVWRARGAIPKWLLDYLRGRDISIALVKEKERKDESCD